jgi:excisionase family DNA binding protein
MHQTNQPRPDRLSVDGSGVPSGADGEESHTTNVVDPLEATPAAANAVPLNQRLALSVEEAGALLGISRDLAYDLVARRELPSVRLGRRLVVPRRALEDALSRLTDAG